MSRNLPSQKNCLHLHQITPKRMDIGEDCSCPEVTSVLELLFFSYIERQQNVFALFKQFLAFIVGLFNSF